MKNSLYPIQLTAHDNGRFITNPPVRKSFMKHKPDGETWYAYDVIIHDNKSATFIVYDMEDFCYGGIGLKKYEFNGVIDCEELKPIIDRKITNMAKALEEAEFLEARNKRVSEIRDELVQKFRA